MSLSLVNQFDDSLSRSAFSSEVASEESVEEVVRFGEPPVKLLSFGKKACLLQGCYAPKKGDLICHAKAICHLRDGYIALTSRRSLICAAALDRYRVTFGARHSLGSASAIDRIAQRLLVLLGIREEFPHLCSRILHRKAILTECREDLKRALEEGRKTGELYLEWTRWFIPFFGEMVDDALRVLGTPPCRFQLFSLGSCSRGEMTPFSDIEFGVLVEGESSTEEVRDYFRRLTYLLHFHAICLGETLIPCMGIKELDGFYDDVTPRGISFDGVAKNACKTPLGKAGVFKLIGTPSELVEQLLRENGEVYFFEKECSLASGLLSTSPLYGEGKLVDAFNTSLSERLRVLPAVKERLLKSFFSDMKDKGFDGSDSHDGKLVKLKHQLYRIPQILADMLALCHDVRKGSLEEKLDLLLQTGAISHQVHDKLVAFFDEVLGWRLRVYFYYGKQKEEIDFIRDHSLNAEHTKDRTASPLAPLMPSGQLIDLLCTSEAFFRAMQSVGDEPSPRLEELARLSEGFRARIYERLGQYIDAAPYYKSPSYYLSQGGSQPGLVINLRGLGPNVSIPDGLPKPLINQGFNALAREQYTEARQYFNDYLRKNLQPFIHGDSIIKEFCEEKHVPLGWVDSESVRCLRGLALADARLFSRECAFRLASLAFRISRVVREYVEDSLCKYRTEDYTFSDVNDARDEEALCYALKGDLNALYLQFSQSIREYEKALKCSDLPAVGRKLAKVLARVEGGKRKTMEQRVRDVEREFGERSEKYAVSLLDLAAVHRHQGAPEKALALCDRLLGSASSLSTQVFCALYNERIVSRVDFLLKSPSTVTKEFLQAFADDAETLWRLGGRALCLGNAVQAFLWLIWIGGKQVCLDRLEEVRKRAYRFLEQAKREGDSRQIKRARRFIRDLDSTSREVSG